MKVFDVKVYRDGKWWMVEIPAIDGLTQARRLGEIETMARSYISVDQDLAPSSVELGQIEIVVAGHDLASTMGQIAALKVKAREAEEHATRLMRSTAHELADADVPLRDIGTALSVTHQRVHQLLQDA